LYTCVHHVGVILCSCQNEHGYHGLYQCRKLSIALATKLSELPHVITYTNSLKITVPNWAYISIKNNCIRNIGAVFGIVRSILWKMCLTDLPFSNKIYARNGLENLTIFGRINAASTSTIITYKRSLYSLLLKLTMITTTLILLHPCEKKFFFPIANIFALISIIYTNIQSSSIAASNYSVRILRLHRTMSNSGFSFGARVEGFSQIANSNCTRMANHTNRRHIRLCPRKKALTSVRHQKYSK
jgi:hypothetical protein